MGGAKEARRAGTWRVAVKRPAGLLGALISPKSLPETGRYLEGDREPLKVGTEAV